jgi:tetratricopeptide (TPR) repeat protein
MKKQYRSCGLVLSLILVLQGRAWAGDPFRSQNPHNIDSKTEAAFEELFHKGNYKAAKADLLEAEKNNKSDPLAFAISGSLAYTEGDYEGLKNYANQTIAAAERLQTTDTLRANIYTGVGYFLQGSYIFKTEGPVQAIAQLQKVLQYLDAAEDVNPKDPELNLIKGYLELLLAVNLPFSSPEKAIDRFQKYAAPSYLVDRGIAMAYRDLKQYDKALEYLDRAIAHSPDNPELQYLKGQVLRIQGLKNKDIVSLEKSITYFDKANQKREQLPKTVLIPLDHDRQSATDELKQLKNGNS